MQRLLTPELMDDPGIDPVVHAHALRGLARLNRLARSDRIPWKALRRWVDGRARSEPISVLDIATGSGDVPLGLARRARRASLDLELHGCDISSVALDHARERAQALGMEFTGFRQDAIREPFTRRYDVVICISRGGREVREIDSCWPRSPDPSKHLHHYVLFPRWHCETMLGCARALRRRDRM